MSAGRRTSLAAFLMVCGLLTVAAPAARAQATGDVPARATLATPDAPVAQTSSSLDFSWLRAGLPLQLGAGLATYSWAGRTFGWASVAHSSTPSLASRSALRSDRWRRHF
jgi:uncharacterized membrane protein